MTDTEYMQIALQEAVVASEQDEVPVGAIIVKEGEIVARANNNKERSNCAVHHAEIDAIMQATQKVGNWWLEGCTLYVTLEPCPMCVGACINSRLDKVVFGAYDEKAGCLGSVCDLNEDYHFNHKLQVVGGVLKDECANLLSAFFKAKRKKSRIIKKI